MNANIKNTIPFGSDIGVWTYVWFGYHWQKNLANGVVKFPQTDQRFAAENARHMVPRYLSLLIGADGKTKGWNGSVQKVGAVFGKGAFFDINKKTFPTGLPKLGDVDTKPGFNKRFEEKEKLALSPKLEDGAPPVYDLEFEKEIGGV